MNKNLRVTDLEIWGGIECTINRVGNEYLDQLEYSGYYKSPQHQLVAELGIKKLRFPILWEKHQPSPDAKINWSWTSQQLHYFKEQKIEVIAGLVHHGSGPGYTNLLDPQFPYLLAEYARKVAMEFPWLQYYTPVNEPLTTARFSGLYGLWYPHAKDDRSFVRALINQMKGVVLSMREIRKINPNAQLVQTEDLGKTYSTPTLRYQARFENKRRWLTYDLLMGKVDEKHKLWKYFLKYGIQKEELAFFTENPCVPDVIGFNYYVTSERFLDERYRQYTTVKPGTNGKHKYVDVEAARVDVEEETGLSVLLKEAWIRFGRPMAITEAHLHCHREEQLRWFSDVWNTCKQAKQDGIDIQAVTSWALFGSYGWDRLLTMKNGTYEPGVFDMRSGNPRRTALTQYIKKIAASSDHSHTLTSIYGWWKRKTRFLDHNLHENCEILQQQVKESAPLLIIGKRGTLGKAFGKICKQRALHYYLVSRDECDLADIESIRKLIRKYKPWGIINAAGYVRVDDAEHEEEQCLRDNHLGPLNLAKVCKENAVAMVTFSTDLVFDGMKQQPYLETDPVNPLNVYGKSKALSEQEVLKVNDKALMIRTSAFFGPWDSYNFLHWVEESLINGKEIEVADDVWISPTYVPDLVHATLDLLIDAEKGIWHLANKGEITWAELALATAKHNDLDTSLIRSVPLADLNYAAPRPNYCVLGTERGNHMPELNMALERYFKEKQVTVTS
jgi:dTDP-4-dehydrorhamnose reductase